MIIKTNIIPKGFDGFVAWPFIFVRPEKAANVGLIEHEMVHYREQAWITPLWGLAYLLSRKFRLAAEVRAYRRQIEVGGITLDRAAEFLLQYRLGITKAEALAALKEGD